MTSIVSICNLALSNLGKSNISSLEDAGAEAKACAQFYDHVRDMLLQSHPWRFAGATRALAQVTNDKPGEWLYAYSRPNECLKIRNVQPSLTVPVDCPNPSGWPHDFEGDTIYCNLSPAFLRFTKRLTDPTRYPPLFAEALACHLSVRLAMPMTRDPKVRADAYNLAIQMQAQAETADANEVRETSDHISEFETGRA